MDVSHSQSRTESRKSESHTSRCSRSSTVQSTPTCVVEASQNSPAAPVANPAQASRTREAAKASGDSESVLKRARRD